MSSPVPAETVLVVPGAVGALADELTALAAELGEDAEHCRATAALLSAALDGHEGGTAGATATAWADLVDILAEETSALARTLTAVVEAYAHEDTRVAAELAPGRTGRPPR